MDFDVEKGVYREGTGPARHSPILGWVKDGYPIYGPYGYASPTDPASGVRRMVSGYVMRDGTNGTTNLAKTGRTTLPEWAAEAQGRAKTLPAGATGPAAGARYPIGHYLEDYDYLGDLGKKQGVDFDLDRCNGRWCVTPEFPQGTYAYFVAIDERGGPVFPYNIGRWFHGEPWGGKMSAPPANAAVWFKLKAKADDDAAGHGDESVIVRWDPATAGYSVKEEGKP